MKNLPGISLMGIRLLLRHRRQRLGIGFGSLQPLRNSLFRHRHGMRRNPGFPEIFLGDNICGNLRPGLRDRDLLHFKNDRTIRILNH